MKVIVYTTFGMYKNLESWNIDEKRHKIWIRLERLENDSDIYMSHERELFNKGIARVLSPSWIDKTMTRTKDDDDELSRESNGKKICVKDRIRIALKKESNKKTTVNGKYMYL